MEFSGIARQPNGDEEEANENMEFEIMMERQNLLQLSQSMTFPVYLRNAISSLNSVGQGGSNITSALLG